MNAVILEFRMALAAVEFTNAAWLAGGAVVIVPILAHLFRRRVRRAIEFPAVRFIRQARAAAEARRRPIDLLLLVMRCGFVACMALGFARPVWKPGKPLAFHRTAEPESETVVVLDTSASMTRAESGTTLFDQAKIAAISILDDLRRKGVPSAVVVTPSAGPRSILPRLSTNFAELRARLHEVSPSFGRGRLDEAIALARNLPGFTARHDIGSDQSPNGVNTVENAAKRRIIVLTDGQASEWNGEVDEATTFDESTVYVRVVGERGRDVNLALHHASHVPAEALVGDVLMLQTEIWFDGPPGSGERSANVRCRIGEQERTRFVEALHPGERRLITVEYAADQADLLPVAWEILDASDVFPLDDQVADALQIDESASILILSSKWQASGDRTARQSFTSTQLMQTAIEPSAASPFQASVIELTDSEGERSESATPGLSHALASCGVAVVVGVDHPSRADIRVIDQFARDGGGLFWILDSPESMAAFRRLGALRELDPEINRRNPGGFELPFYPEGWQMTASASSPGRADRSMALPEDPSARHEASRFLDAVVGDEVVDMIGRSEFEGRALGRVTDRGTALLNWADLGSSALVTGRLGNGRVAVLAGSIDPRFSDVHRNPAIVPLVHGLLRYLNSSGEIHQTGRPGSELFVHLPGDETPPDALQIEPRGLEWSLVDEGGIRPRSMVRIESAENPGLIRVIDQISRRVVGLGAVELDPSESLLEPIRYVGEQTVDPSPQAELPLPSGSNPAPGAEPVGNVASLHWTQNQTIELWPWLAALGLALLFFETATIVGLAKGRRSRRIEDPKSRANRTPRN